MDAPVGRPRVSSLKSGVKKMASPTGGRFVFSPPAGFSQVNLGINNGSSPVFPGPVSGAFNIEVFTSPTVGSGVPNPDSGWSTSVADVGGTLFNNFLTGTSIQLGTGNYLITDSVVGGGQGPARIQAGSGNQTVVGAGGDTLVGG